MAKVKVKDGELFYREFGDGPPMLLHHGLSRTSDYWMGFDKELSKHYHVIAFDTRGLGESSKSKVPISLSIFDLARDVRELVDHLKLDSSHMLGTSMGGMVSLAYALEYPEVLDSIIVVNSSLAGLTPRLSATAVASIALMAAVPSSFNIVSGLTLLGRSLPLEKRKEIMAEWKKTHSKQKISRTTVFKHMIAAARFGLLENIQDIDTPTLVLYGDQDLFVPIKNSLKIYNKLPNSQIRKISEGGHEMFVEKPKEIVDEILDFTQSVA